MPLNEENLNLSIGNYAYILTFLSACIPRLAKFFYMSYRLIIGTLYPTYLSYKALKNKDEKECIRLIMYWIVFSVFSFLEVFLDIFIGFWLPFYYESKLIFIFWLISPYGNGARILYENIVNKKFEEHEEVIDEFINNVKIFSIDIFWSIWDKFSFYFTQLLVISISKAQCAAIQYVHNKQPSTRLMIDENDGEIRGKTTSTITNRPLINMIEESHGHGRDHAGISFIDEDITTDNEPLVEMMDTENEEPKIEESKPITKKPVRKTKRKKMNIEETTKNRPTTRSTKKITPIDDVDY